MRTWPALEIQRADPEIGDLVQAFLLDFGVAAIDDGVPDLSRVFFHDTAGRDRAAEGLRSQFPAIGVRAVDVPDEDWAARSQASLRAVQVGDIIVAPQWDVPPADAGRQQPIILVIQPSMGFGTGHHATTRLCLAALQRIDLRGLRVLDAGTGSGVLAMAASRLGAATVVGIDDDPDAINAARESLALNPDARVALDVVDFRIPNPAGAPARFDVVVANLTGGLLIATAARLRSFAGPSGRLVLSGFMDHEEGDVCGAFSTFRIESRTQEDEWVCLELAPDRE